MTFRQRLIVLACVLALAAPASALAQGGYFGRNKVQYHKFDFKTLKTEHFDIYFYPEEKDAAEMASRMAERWYARISSILGHQLRGRQSLILYASGPHFRETNVIEGDLGEGTGGVTEAYKRRIVLPFAGPLAATDHVLGHELVHAFQYDITNVNVSSGNAGALQLPLWFIEGMAEYISIGPVDAHTAMWMREATRREKLPDIKNLNDPKYFPYRYGQALWAFIGGKYGDKAVGDMLRMAVGKGGYDLAFQEVLGIDENELSKQWHQAEFEAFKPVAQVTQMPAQFAQPLVTSEGVGGVLNVSPELSPDGAKIMFFSEKDLFSIDLFVADAKTGKILRKITDTATDGHLESIQFIGSAGAWSSDNRRFVFPGIVAGRPVLRVVDADNGKFEREISLTDIDEVLNPAWSADGSQIVFSGLVGGFNDLFLLDVQSGSTRRLTTDAYAEMDPAWSPDGKLIAFSTDRFTTNLEKLKAGDMRIAAIDVVSGAVRQVGGFEGAKNIGPQWSADGRSLYFLSDRQGVTNIYRTPVEGGNATQLTNLLTGVTGITALSPAMSVANDRIVFSAYENDGYNIYAVQAQQLSAADGLKNLPINAAVLPPRTVGNGTIYAAVNDDTLGLPPLSEVPPEEPYKPKLGLLFAGQPMVAVGTDPFGTYVGGSIALAFSDPLGNHTLSTWFQGTNRLDEIGGGAMYMNKTHRWNWGIEGDQTPYVASSFGAQYGVINGQDVYVESEYRILQVDRGVSGILAYPLSRANRLELNTGFRQITYSVDAFDTVYSLDTGQEISTERSTVLSYPNLNLGQVSGALVHDTSIFGATSPIRGTRSRIDLSQNAGSLTYSGVLADLRTYLMPVRPFTLALRGLYYGRFGTDSENPQLPSLYLGYPGLVRGYESNSFQPGECGTAVDGSCPSFDRLLGSRVAVANAEFRFPLWGAIHGGSSLYGPLPVEVGAFVDAGIAWSRNNSLYYTGDHKPVSSVGAVARVNLFGFAVAEIDYVRPLQRPGRGWVWQFTLQPGF